MPYICITYSTYITILNWLTVCRQFLTHLLFMASSIATCVFYERAITPQALRTCGSHRPTTHTPPQPLHPRGRMRGAWAASLEAGMNITSQVTLSHKHPVELLPNSWPQKLCEIRNVYYGLKMLPSDFSQSDGYLSQSRWHGGRTPQPWAAMSMSRMSRTVSFTGRSSQVIWPQFDSATLSSHKCHLNPQ